MGAHDDVLRALQEATETARSIRVELTDDYLAMIAAVEALPQNQSGSDKSRRGRPGRAHRALHVVGPLLPKQP
jgi:hypothetical protein